MKETLKVINDMQAAGVIGRYAIGGAVGATFYIEPVSTQDIDIFVSFNTVPGYALISLEPIYDYLKERNCRLEREYVIIAGWQVQFLPPRDALGEEALRDALQTDLDGTPTWVIRAEHLVALALHLGRSKDHARIVQFIEGGHVDPLLLNQILSRHDMVAKWQQFGDKFLSDR